MAVLQASHLQNKERNKSQPKAHDWYYVGPSVDHPGDCMRVLTAHRSILTTQNVTWQHVPSAPLAPLQQLPPIAVEAESTAGEGASREGASSRGGGTLEDLNSESDLDMTEVWPPVPPAARETPAAEPEAWAGGRGQKATPRRYRSPPGGPISVASTAAVAAAAATTAASAVTAATATTAGTFPRLWGDLRGTWRFSTCSPHCKADARGPSREV